VNLPRVSERKYIVRMESKSDVVPYDHYYECRKNDGMIMTSKSIIKVSKKIRCKADAVAEFIEKGFEI
jgi:hypothetical protein